MAKDSGSMATGAAAFKLGPPPGVPKEVQASFLLWLTAVAAGVVETIVRVIYSLSVESNMGDGVISGVIVRVIVYAAAVYVIAQMRLGKRWARITLAVLLGGIGTLSLVIDPISWLAGGNSLREVFTEADLLFVFVAPVRVVHLAAVIAALVFMFLPAANTYFRAGLASANRTKEERDMDHERIDRNSQPPDPRRWKALTLLGTAFFMVILDATIVLTAVPSMQEDLNLSVSGVQWVLTGYSVTFGGLMLFFGRVADLMGRRRVFMAGVVLFIVSSLLCGLAWSGELLIAARALQGVSAAIMAPTALSIVVTTFSDSAERNKALGIWGGLGGVGATAGLLLGGVITSGLGWEWIFLINVPVGLVILLLGPVLIRESRDRVTTRRFDASGAVTITAALVLLIYAVIQAPEVGWGSAQTIALLAASAALIVLFGLIEARSAAPLVPLRIFGLRTLVGGNVVIFAVGMAVDGMLFPLTLYTQQVLRYSALQFSLASAVMTVMSIIGAFAGQALVTKVGLRPVAVAAMILIASACLLLIPVSVAGTFFGDLFWGLLVFGPGMGAAFVSSQIAALTGVADQESGLAAGLVDTSFNIGSALGIAIATSVAVSVTNHVLAGGQKVGPLVALTEGLQSAFLMAMVFAGLGLLAALFLPGRTPSPVDESTKVKFASTKD